MVRRLKNYCINEGAKLFIMVLWLGINATLFYFTFKYYYYGPQFFYLHQMLGYGLCISRATAACINLNACVILLPMCRGVLRIFRAFPVVCRQFRRLLDKSKSFHITCGYMLCLMSAVHCGAHAFNAFNFCEHFNSRFPDVNVASFAHQNPFLVVVKSVPGTSGLLMVTCLITIVVTASSPLRRASYRRFWKTHHLFIAFYGLLLIHACSGILKYQSNVEEHIPGCYVKVSESGDNITIIMPEPEAEAEPNSKAEHHYPRPEAGNFHFPEAEFHHPEPEAKSYYLLPEAESHHPMPEAETGKAPVPESESYNPSPNYRVQPCKQPKPQFKSCPTESWLWLSIPLVLYALERISRYVKSSGTPLEVRNVVEHPNNVVEVEFYQKNFKALPGQSIWLRCPQISFVEAHPFTLTSISTADNPNFTIHMLALGEWTQKARDLLIKCFRQIKNQPGRNILQLHSRSDQQCTVSEELIQVDHSSLCTEDTTIEDRKHCVTELSMQTETKSSSSLRSCSPVFYAQGPYGSAMQDIFRYEVSLCVAGGIGITPFAAILNILLNHSNMRTQSKLRRIYLIWTCKTVVSFEWFVKLINSVQNKLWNENKPDFLNIYLHVTSADNDVEKNLCTSSIGLERCRFKTGRPDLKNIFNELANRHSKTSIGVFCCGPRSLNNSVRKHCFSCKGRNNKFVFNKESF